MVILLRLLDGLLLFAGDGDPVSGDRDVKVLRVDARQLGLHRDFLVRFADVEGGGHLAAPAKRFGHGAEGLAKVTVEHPIDLAAQIIQRRYLAAGGLTISPRNETHDFLLCRPLHLRSAKLHCGVSPLNLEPGSFSDVLARPLADGASARRSGTELRSGW